MANTVGKISGPMLESNLVRRDMQTGDENLAFDNDLIFLDVWNKRVGINTDVPIRPLQIQGTLKTLNLLVDTQASIPNYIISSNIINNSDNDIFLSATGIGASINAKTIQVDGLQFDTNRLLSLRSNENIDIFPNASGQIIFNSNVEVFGNLHATGNITFDGNVTLGNSNTDNVIFNADINGNIVPNLTDTYSLGTITKRWSVLNTDLVNGTAYSAGSLTTPGGIDFGLRQGNIWYVSANGSNSNVGDHPNGPFATVEFALASATNGDTVYIYPGTYMENFPLIVPAGVAVKGESIRSVKIIPQASSNDQDAFLLNGESTLSDLTIANFFYNSATNTGYALKFANNFTVTSRSPYIQNISVITENESTLASAGRGAYIDGSVANSSSVEASMLFHSCTFITPNADCIVMKNGVRVEWLNSFIYYANRGLYAENGSLGFANLGTKFGAEIRSIGSANVYGNYGAWADGNEVLMYLINHNFGYMGSGLDSNNDPTEVIQANETVELNGGKIYYQSMDQIGDFRVGNIFRVNSETGQIEFQTGVVSQSSINLFDGTNTTYIDANEITTGNITISGNTISSNLNEINLTAANNQISITSNVDIAESLSVNNNVNLNSNVTFGNQTSDTLTFNNQIVGSLIPTNTGQYSLGSLTRSFKKLYGSAFILDDIVIDTNVITTTQSNSNLELRANGTGNIRITDNLTVGGNLTISGSSTLSNVNLPILNVDNIQAGNLITVATTNTFDDIQFNGNRISTIVSNADLELVSNSAGIVVVKDNLYVNQTLIIDGISYLQNVDIAQTLNVQNLYVITDVTAPTFSTGDIVISNNVITTTQSNSNLDLRTNGTGIVNIQENTLVDGTLTVNGISNLFGTNVVGTTTVTNTIANDSLTATNFYNGNIEINDNFISTTQINNNLNLLANGTGFVNFQDTVVLDNNLTVYGFTNFRNTSVTGTTTTNNTDVFLNFTTNNFQSQDILINDNFITTTQSNSNLDLRTNGTGNVVFNDNLLINSDLSILQSAFLQNTNIFGTTVVPNIIVSNNVNTSEYYNGDILINTNFITTTLSNSNLEFRADGSNSGVIVDQTFLLRTSTLSNNLSVGTEAQRSIEFVPFTSKSLIINSTDALTVPVGNNLNRILASPGEIRLNNNNQRFEGRISSGVRQLYGLYDQDQNTFISAELSPGVNDNTIRMFINGSLTSTITEQATTFQQVRIDELNINNNVISTVNSNSNIELVQSGSGIINIKDNFQISTNLIKNYNTGAVTTIDTTGAYVQFTGDNAVVIPSGTTGQRLASPPLGASRWNTNIQVLEVWDGSVWASAAGAGSGITGPDMEELVNILTLVLA